MNYIGRITKCDTLSYFLRYIFYGTFECYSVTCGANQNTLLWLSANESTPLWLLANQREYIRRWALLMLSITYQTNEEFPAANAPWQLSRKWKLSLILMQKSYIISDPNY